MTRTLRLEPCDICRGPYGRPLAAGDGVGAEIFERIYGLHQ